MRLLMLVIFTCATATMSAAQQPQSTGKTAQPCSEPEQRQLDFWIGSWDLTWPGNTAGQLAHGTNNVTRILDGCVVQENFSGGDAMPLRGLSVSLFNARSGKWQQTWVDDRGGVLEFSGEFKDGALRLQAEQLGQNGKKMLQRMTFTQLVRLILNEPLWLDQAKRAQVCQSADPRSCKRACLFCVVNSLLVLHAANRVHRDPDVLQGDATTCPTQR